MIIIIDSKLMVILLVAAHPNPSIMHVRINAIAANLNDPPSLLLGFSHSSVSKI